MSVHNTLEPRPRESTAPRGACRILCGRSPIAPSREACTERLHAGLLRELLTPTYHAAPSQTLPALFKTNPHALPVSTWGGIPAWALGTLDIRTPHQGGVTSMACSCTNAVFLVTHTLPQGTEVHRQ